MTPDHANRYSAAAAHSFTSFDEAAMLVRIGGDLRDLYGDVEGAALPKDLLLLATLIDKKRQPNQGNDSGA